MKQIFVLAVALLSFLSGIAQGNKTAPLTDVVEKISNSWIDVEAQNRTGVKLESVSASFSLSKTTSKGGEIKIWIFKLGRKTERTKVHKVTLDLARPEKDKAPPRKENDSAKELTNFINAALADFQKLNERNILPDLSQRKITLEVGLTITKGNNAGAEYEIGIFTLSAEGGKSNEQGNTLTLVFSKI